MGLGFTYAIEDTGADEAVATLDTAAFLLPLDTRPRLALAHLHIRRGHPDKALPELRFVLRWAANPAARSAARELLDRLGK